MLLNPEKTPPKLKSHPYLRKSDLLHKKTVDKLNFECCLTMAIYQQTIDNLNLSSSDQNDIS